MDTPNAGEGVGEVTMGRKWGREGGGANNVKWPGGGGGGVMLNRRSGKKKKKKGRFLAVGEECMTVLPTQRWDSSAGKAD